MGDVRRIGELDALRGFAVCGIMAVNTWQHTERVGRTAIDQVVETALQGRFYPIFSLLFGISFVLFLRGNGRWTLVLRLLWLLLFGLLQHTFYPGEVLTDYALFGLAVLLPASFLASGPPVLLLGLGVLAWGVTQGGGILLIPGLFLIGMALMDLRPSRRLLLPAFVVSAAASAALTWLWLRTGDWTFNVTGALTGAAAYATGLLLVLRPWLSALLEPLGRTALTNYVTGTFVIFLTAPLLSTDPTRWSVVALVLATLLAQVLFSGWWLSRYRYGPLEWVWRCLTRLRRVPNRRGAELESAP